MRYHARMVVMETWVLWVPRREKWDAPGARKVFFGSLLPVFHYKSSKFNDALKRFAGTAMGQPWDAPGATFFLFCHCCPTLSCFNRLIVLSCGTAMGNILTTLSYWAVLLSTSVRSSWPPASCGVWAGACLRAVSGGLGAAGVELSHMPPVVAGTEHA